VEEDTRADVDHLHLAVAVGFYENVLRFQVAVDYMQSVEGG
jgi:hypothetical protein